MLLMVYTHRCGSTIKISDVQQGNAERERSRTTETPVPFSREGALDDMDTKGMPDRCKPRSAPSGEDPERVHQFCNAAVASAALLLG